MMKPDEFRAWLIGGHGGDRIKIKNKFSGEFGIFCRLNLLFPFSESQDETDRLRTDVLRELFTNWDIIGPLSGEDKYLCDLMDKSLPYTFETTKPEQ